jgi:hypothetical protein
VQPHGNVTYVAAIPGQSIFDGKVCEEKAALVMRGQSMHVEGWCSRMRAFDANGAGIRLERGDLTVREAWFRDSEQGILSANYPAGHVLIEQSRLPGWAAAIAGPARSLYFGDEASVIIRRSRFEEGTGGHYVKSHAGRIEVTDWSLTTAGAIPRTT